MNTLTAFDGKCKLEKMNLVLGAGLLANGHPEIQI